MATAPIFVGTPKSWAAEISAANTNRDGTGTVVTLATAGANGSLIDRLHAVAEATTTAGVVRLFLHDGTIFILWRELLVPAITPSATVEVWWTEIDCNGLVLP